MKYSVHFEATAAVGVELSVEADSEQEAEAQAKKIWREKSVAERISYLIDIDENAREGFADALGVNIPYATVSIDDAGFRHVDTFETL